MSLQEGEQSGETENNMNFGLLSRQVKNTESAYTSGKKKKKNKQEKMEERTFLLKKRSKSKSRQHKNMRVTQQRQLFKWVHRSQGESVSLLLLLWLLRIEHFIQSLVYCLVFSLYD